MAPIISSDRLKADHLVNLCEGRAAALRIPGYYPPDLALTLSQTLRTHPRFGHYGNAADIGRVGMAFFETVNAGVVQRNEYYAQAGAAIEELRVACEPYYSPMDRLRLQLQELWPAGAELMNLDGRPMFVGLARVFEHGSAALPHQDVLRRDAPDCPRAGTLITQVAANVYLQTSDSGGELELWPDRLNDTAHEALLLPNSYGLDSSRLTSSTLLLTPQQGELILFDATHVHAVRAAQQGPRVTISCFIGYAGRDQPLMLWS